MPDADVVLHPYSGEAGAIGAALCAGDWRERGGPSRFRGFEAIEALTYTSTTSAETVCHWCPVNCTRTFIDVQLPGARGRPWSKVPLVEGWQRVISGNSCPKGLVEDVTELRVVKSKLEEVKRGYPNVAEVVRTSADQPTYTPVQQIVERSGTLFFSFQDLDSTKPAGSVKMRVETIAHYLEKYARGIIEQKRTAMPPDCPLL